MAVKRKNLFLYLTLVCFLGLILIFIFDGYMGVYDTVTVNTGEYEEEIEADYWLRQDRYWSIGVAWGGKAFFRYEVDNRTFSDYAADIEVSVWHSQEKVADLIAQPMSVASFDKGELEWVMDTAQLVPADVPPEQGYEFTVVIKRGELERSIITNVRAVPYPPKVVIPEPPR